MHESGAVFLPLAEVLDGFRSGSLSPVELTHELLARIALLDGELHSYLRTSEDLALTQAKEAERRYRETDGWLPPLLGLPLSIKDLFDVQGVPTTLGSRVYGISPAPADSYPVARLRAAGAVFLGKTNTAEFGQSAITANLLGPACGNPWGPERTAGGSSGGAAASVAAGLACAALGSDGGGSVRIPAAMCGLVGLKPTWSPPPGEERFRAMVDYVCPGPLVRTVADARLIAEVLLDRPLASSRVLSPSSRRIAWCPAPEGRPVEPGVALAVEGAVRRLVEFGAEVVEVELPLEGWLEAFRAPVLADEWRERRRLLESHRDQLTSYARKAIEAGEAITQADVEEAHQLAKVLRQRMDALFEGFDLVLTPATASVAFAVGSRPTEIAGRAVEPLWGPFPFTAPFNVLGLPAATVPVGLHEGLPVGLQVVGPRMAEAAVLDLCGDVEALVSFPRGEMSQRWGPQHDRIVVRDDNDLTLEHIDSIAVVRINRPQKRNALRKSSLRQLQLLLAAEVEAGASAIVVTGDAELFSAGFDLSEIGRGLTDLEVDQVIEDTVAAIHRVPVPVLAAIEGPCIGAALEIAVACDVRVAGSEAIFALPATKLGVLYRPDGVAGLIDALGRETASRLLVLGDRIISAEAAAAGLAAIVVDAGKALDRAIQLAQSVDAASSEAVAATKQLIAEICEHRSDLSHWEERRRQLLLSESRHQAVASAGAGRAFESTYCAGELRRSGRLDADCAGARLRSPQRAMTAPGIAHLAGWELGTRRVSYNERDAILYAVAVGADPDDLEFVYERQLQVLPTFALPLGLWAVEAAGDLGAYDRGLTLHVGQELEIREPLPAAGAIETTGRVRDVWDKGSAALVDVCVESAYFRAVYVIYIPNGGGFGGERGPSRSQPHSTTSKIAPEGANSRSVHLSVPTASNQAVLYRLTGDRHPVHVDPESAHAAGFERPILHGLCTLGLVVVAVARGTGRSPLDLGTLTAQLTSPVLPGNTIEVTCLTEPGNGVVEFSAFVGDAAVTAGIGSFC